MKTHAITLKVSLNVGKIRLAGTQSQRDLANADVQMPECTEVSPNEKGILQSGLSGIKGMNRDISTNSCRITNTTFGEKKCLLERSKDIEQPISTTSSKGEGI